MVDETRIRKDNVIAVANAVLGYKYFDQYVERKCPQCKEKYKRYSGEMDYKLFYKTKTLIFCSYNCRSKFKQEHPEEYENQGWSGGYNNVRNKGPQRKRCVVDGKVYVSIGKASIAEFGSVQALSKYKRRNKLGNEFTWKGKHVQLIEDED